jgi:hypothetical protein
MKARDERAMARLDRAASELGLPTKSRVRLFLEDPPPMYEQYVAKLQGSVKRLHELKFEQYVLTPQHAAEGKNTEFLRKRLRREYMIPLTRTGKPLLSFAPGVEKALKVPHARASHRELVTTAEVMLKTVRPYHKLLISEGFPKAFFTELRDLTKELKRIATTSSQRQAKFARVSGELREELARGNETLRILDGLVLARADRDPEFAKTWKDVLRTPKPLGRPRAKRRKAPPNDEAANGSREKPLIT